MGSFRQSDLCRGLFIYISQNEINFGGEDRMRVAICGGTGFIGSALSEHLLKNEHEVTVVTRKLPPDHKRDPRLVFYTWDEIASHPELMEGIDALVNLAGSSLSQRWTAKAKDSIIQSRLTTV